LQGAENALNQGDLRLAINTLQAFIHEVEAQRGKALTDDQAAQLIAQANAIIKRLSGSGSLLAPTFIPSKK